MGTCCAKREKNPQAEKLQHFVDEVTEKAAERVVIKSTKDEESFDIAEMDKPGYMETQEKFGVKQSFKR